MATPDLFKTMLLMALTPFIAAAAPPVVLVEDGAARCAIHVPAATLAADVTLPRTATHAERQTEDHRRRLRDSALDLAACLKKMSGAQVPVLSGPPAAGTSALPILVGALAVESHGPPAKTTVFKQGWRLVVSAKGIGLLGETDEAASYAVYELLERLGCRWYVPGEIGEVIPERASVSLAPDDLSSAPSTPYRGIWYGSAAFKRRNRLGGFNIAAGHALHGYIPKDILAANPELNAEHDGKRDIDCGFLCWGNPATAEAVATSIIGRLDKAYTPSVSLSPNDGVNFCQCEKYCRPLDAGDWDPTMDTESLTDRYIVFCNRIVERVTAKYPDVQFGFLAYVQYTRPPVREKPHANLVPDFAPITYCRAHAMTADNCVSRARLKPIVEGWNRVAKRIAYYNYMFHLAETTVPYPMIRQMSEELPIIYGGAAEIFWQPETMPNFDSVAPGMWLSLRLAWDSGRDPAAVMAEYFSGFHGAAGPAMQRYWQIIDDAWHTVPEHAGCGWGHDRRFTAEVMAAARDAMDAALAAAETSIAYRRVVLFNDALRQFERYMQMRRDLAGGKLGTLHLQALEWMGTEIGLGNQYAENAAFGKVRWGSKANIGAGYFGAFQQKTYDDIGERVGRGGAYALLDSRPLGKWRWQMIEKPQADGDVGIGEGEQAGWQQPAFNDKHWPQTDPAIETWASLGLLGKYGTMWYRTTVKVRKPPAGKKLYLWLAATDGSAKVYVNGRHIPYTATDGKTTPVASGYASPFLFDVSDVLTAGSNHVAIAGTRLFINELGTGGLIGPAYLLRDK
jgi:hypothetical protein